MRSTWLLVTACAACGFDGSQSDGLPSDEDQLVIDTTAELASGIAQNESLDAFVSASGTVEPISWLNGRLLTEIDEGDGPFGGWDAKPARDQMANIGLMHPSTPDNQRPPGAPGTSYILWFSGEIRLDQGTQKIALASGLGAEAFAEILKDNGEVLSRCDSQLLECTLNSPAAGWYPLRMGWHRPAAATSSALELQWLAGGVIGVPTKIGEDRVRVRASDAALNGWRMEAYEEPRALSMLPNGIALNYVSPFLMKWVPSLLGRDNGSPGYRSAAQLRFLEEGSYDFALTAGGETSFRLWIDGEWVTKATNWDPLPGGEHSETITRTLAAGWHDIAIEAYENGGTSNEVQLKVGRTGGTLTAPLAVDARPLLSAATSTQAGQNNNPVRLERNVTVTQIVNVAAVAGTPNAAGVDVFLRLQPKQWQGLTVKLRPPGSATSIPLVINTAGLSDDIAGDLLASLNRAALGAMPVSGDWAIEVTHPDAGTGFGVPNSITRARLSVRYAGDSTSTPKQIAERGRYVKMVSLDSERELRGLVATAITPAGSSIELQAQVCADASGSGCNAPVSAAQLEASKPRGQHVKITVRFLSEGFATPILDKVALRFQK
jgi:hypothetical protein